MTNQRPVANNLKITLTFSLISLAVYFISDVFRYKFDIGLIFLNWDGFFLNYGTTFITWFVVSILSLSLSNNIPTDLAPKPILIRMTIYIIISMLFEATLMLVFSNVMKYFPKSDFFADFLNAFNTSVYHASVLTVVWIVMINKKGSA